MIREIGKEEQSITSELNKPSARGARSDMLKPIKPDKPFSLNRAPWPSLPLTLQIENEILLPDKSFAAVEDLQKRINTPATVADEKKSTMEATDSLSFVCEA